MGYTHNWKRPTELKTDRFAAAVRDCASVLKATDIEIAGFDGTGNPVFADDHVVFNGATPRACEPFEIRRVEFDRRGRDSVWTFCKTEHLPYDLCVKIALIIFAHHLGDNIVVSSDGGNSDWEDAKGIVQRHLGFGQEFHLDTAD